ncbi:MAG: DUF456 family protein [Bacteroidales bacterium]|nr:DUF456 family protein [Bacteroidales bacterium]
MNTLLIVCAYLLLALGVVAVFLPFPPAVPAAWAGLMLASVAGVGIGRPWLVWTAVAGLALMVADYVVPILTTRRFGGSKWGVWGCTIGLLVGIVGVPFGPGGLVGLFFWPFVGALVGEWMKQRQWKPALRAAWGAFIGLMTGTLAKVAYAIVLAVKVTVALI